MTVDAGRGDNHYCVGDYPYLHSTIDLMRPIVNIALRAFTFPLSILTIDHRLNRMNFYGQYNRLIDRWVSLTNY